MRGWASHFTPTPPAHTASHSLPPQTHHTRLWLFHVHMHSVAKVRGALLLLLLLALLLVVVVLLLLLVRAC